MTAIKAIKIEEANAQAIEAALKAANGKAKDHVYKEFGEILFLAQYAEQSMERMGIAKARRAGASVEATSGKPVPNAYKYSRAASRVKVERRSSAWYLTDIELVTIWKDGGVVSIQLTKAQDEEAVANLRKKYQVKAC